MEHSALGAREEKRKFWEQHLTRWETSGLSQKEYCRQNDLKIHCFVYWRKKQRSRPASTTGLVEWLVPRPKGGMFRFGPALSLVVDNRHRIEIHQDFDPCVLDRVIRVLMQL